MYPTYKILLITHMVVKVRNNQSLCKKDLIALFVTYKIIIYSTGNWGGNLCQLIDCVQGKNLTSHIFMTGNSFPPQMKFLTKVRLLLSQRNLDIKTGYLDWSVSYRFILGREGTGCLSLLMFTFQRILKKTFLLHPPD